MAAEDPRLLELYVSCGESLVKCGDLVQAQDLLTAAVYMALGLGDARAISRCQNTLLQINKKHPAVLPDFDRNVKIQAHAAKIQQRYTPQKMEVLRHTLDELEAASRAERSMLQGGGTEKRPETREKALPPTNPPTAPPPRRPTPEPPTPVVEVQPIMAGSAPSAGAKSSRPATAPAPTPLSSPPAPVPSPRKSRPEAAPPHPSAPADGPTPLPAFAREPMPPSSHEVNAQDGSTVRIRPTRPAAKPAQRPLFIAILSEEMQWESLCPIGPNGVEIGRDQPGQPFADVATLARRHARFHPNEQGLIVVEDLGSAGGVFQRIKQKEALADGVWLRIGSQLLEFRLFQQHPEANADGERLWAPSPIASWAELVVLRADREPSARYPIVPSEVILGREASRGADLVLYGDRNASSRHARIRRTPDGADIEDLGSLNGTYIRREAPFAVGTEDILMLGEVMLKIVDKA